jgi:hypothetical protein
MQGTLSVFLTSRSRACTRGARTLTLSSSLLPPSFSLLLPLPPPVYLSLSFFLSLSLSLSLSLVPGHPKLPANFIH